MKENQVSQPGTSGVGGLFRTKPLDKILRESEEPGHQLKRQLGPVQITLLGIGAIIGAGIFATIGTAAKGEVGVRPGAGPALMLSFVITAIVCVFTALCYAEFASMIPISGSAYTYSYATLGEGIAWIIGWDLIIEYAVGNIGVAISWANYFKTLLARTHIPGLFPEGIHVKPWLSMDYRTAAKLTQILPGGREVNEVFDHAPHLFGYPIVFNALAVGIVVLITLILLIGVRESAWFNAIMVGIKIVVLTFFIIVGFLWLDTSNWSPFMPPAGWAGISAGAAVVFFAYIGFDAVSTVAEETKNPQRNLPIGIFASLIICTVFYIAVAAIFTGLISYKDLQAKNVSEDAEPLTMALLHANPAAKWAVVIVAFGSVIAHTAVLLVYQLGQPRIFFSMARDGLMPPAFCRVHPVFRVPHIGTILTGVLVATFAAFANIDEMVDLTNIGTLFAFILVCAGIIVLRLKYPERPRPFRVPSGWLWAGLMYAAFAGGVWFLSNWGMGRIIPLVLGAVLFAAFRNHIFPLLGILSCLYLVYYLPETSWLRFAAWLNVGFIIYVGYGAVHSRLTGRASSTQPAEHDARTATIGFWLALLGAGLLVLMHGLTLGLKTYKNHPDFRSVVRQIFQPRSWLYFEHGWKNEAFWFLLLPLALNAAVLCPIVIARARRSRRQMGARPRSWAQMVSLFGAAGITAAVLVYFALIATYHG